MIEILLILGLRAYGFGVVLLTLNTLARLVFGEVKFQLALRTIFAAFFWPLFLFSKRGRRRLAGKINKL